MGCLFFILKEDKIIFRIMTDSTKINRERYQN